MSCPQRPEQLSAFVDGALPHRDRDRLAAHLLDCPDCRAEVTELRRLRERMRTTAAPEATPDDLAARLVGIAGPSADAPLYARPFDQRPVAGRLPRPRRRTRTMLLAGAAGVVAVTASWSGIGWYSAPLAQPPIVDPVPVARAEFAGTLGSAPLPNDALSAAFLADRSNRLLAEAYAPATTDQLGSEGAYAWLERAEAASRDTDHRGRQLVQVRHLAGYSVIDLKERHRAGAGAAVTLRRGHDRSGGYLPEQASIGAELIARHYTLATGAGPDVAGRPSQLVEARSGERAVARWWLDRQTAVVLWQQSLDDSGRTVVSAGFRDIDLGAVGGGEHLPPRVTRSAATPVGLAPTTMLSRVTQLSDQGWHCAGALAGQDLVRLGGDEGAGVLQAVYGDGVHTTSVFQQRGRLSGTPAGFAWDPRVGAYRNQGVTPMFVWQSGERVFTLITDGSAELATRAVTELPHEPPPELSPLERVVAGWRALLAG